jgi:hypothetical protein
MKNKLLLIAMGIALSAQTLMAQVPSYVPTNGLVGYWPFDGNANDVSGNGNNGTNNGATLTTDRNGNANSAYYFSGSGCNTRIDAQVNTSSIQTGLTISIWILRVGDGCLGPRILEFWPEDNPNGQGMAQWGWENGNNSLYIGSTTSGGCYTTVPVNGNNIWYNIVYTNDGTTGKFYKDGLLISSIPSNGNPTLAGNAAFGRMNHGGFDAFNGKLDDIGVWNRALTQQEITNIYNSSLPQTTCLPANVPTTGLVGYWPFCGNANDESGNANNGTVNGATLTADRFGNANSAYNFDGNNFTRITIQDAPNLNLTNDFTISSWIRGTSYESSSNTVRMIISKAGDNVGNPNGYNYGIWGDENLTDNQTGSINFQAQPFNNPSTYPIGSTGLIQINNWYNFVVTYSKSTSTLNYYLNNVLIDTKNLAFNIGVNTNELWIGSQASIFNTIKTFNGDIDDVGIWNRALSQAEITNLYNANQCLTNITVTDTLIINVGQLSFNDPVTWANNITIFPNPASSQININFNNITNLNGGTLKIINSLGQEVATTTITTSGTQSTMQLASWGGTGMYFVQIINPQGQIVDIKKIILQ